MAFALIGCHKPLSHPESVDPIYLETKKDLDSVIASIEQAEKDKEKAKTALDLAPIRTGQRQDAEETFFEVLHKLDKLSEKYRYLALKMHSLKHYDQREYKKALKEKQPWPNEEAYNDYLVERRLASAPKEWNPENRIKHKSAPIEKSAEKPKEH